MKQTLCHLCCRSLGDVYRYQLFKGFKNLCCTDPSKSLIFKLVVMIKKQLMKELLHNPQCLSVFNIWPCRAFGLLTSLLHHVWDTWIQRIFRKFLNLHPCSGLLSKKSSGCVSGSIIFSLMSTLSKVHFIVGICRFSSCDLLISFRKWRNSSSGISLKLL
ncbi:unnamed protein product [Moneuplotes crassus]|uniref:Uncharacterized protein n=1 Tax=Euplotes crassus TaxID=5936 RepID=A0AAD1Y503_EUPCR|nr:unnamed protein product [Moneuplotes crassus]